MFHKLQVCVKKLIFETKFLETKTSKFFEHVQVKMTEYFGIEGIEMELFQFWLQTGGGSFCPGSEVKNSEQRI